MFEQQPEPFSGQPYVLLEFATLDPKDLDGLLRNAVAAEVALGFAQGPQPAHASEGKAAPGRKRYSYWRASRTFRRAARRAGKIAARIPTMIAAITK